MPEYRYRFGERLFTVSIENTASSRQRAVIREGESQTIVDFSALLLNGEWRLQILDQQFRGIVSSNGDGREIWLNGFTYLLNRVHEREGQSSGSVTVSGRVEAQMPGLVRDVQVQDGDSVEHGQTLVILEAMKMEMRVPAPFDGMVKQVHIAKDMVVTRGQVLVEIEPAGVNK